jgi:SAM-dependent methyltransferase
MNFPDPRELFTLDRRAVARAFDRASGSYDAAAALQERVRNELVTRLDELKVSPTSILDLGAGTGHGSRALKRRFPGSLVVAADIAPGMLERARRQSRWLRRFSRVRADAYSLPFVDGSFESGFGYHEGSVFGWKVTAGPQAQIGIDPEQGYQSGRSLRLQFQVRSRLDAINVSQLIPVTADTAYELEFAVKTQKLESADLLSVAIFDEVEGKLLAQSEETTGGTNDWKIVTVRFKTGPKTQAIKMRLHRNACPPEGSCPIYGTVWYDNFNLQRRG